MEGDPTLMSYIKIVAPIIILLAISILGVWRGR